MGHTGVAQSSPAQPLSQLHRRLPRVPMHAPWLEQPPGHSTRSHRAPPHPASQAHLPGLTHVPCTPQPLPHAAFSQWAPDQPSWQRHIAAESARERSRLRLDTRPKRAVANEAGNAQWPRPLQPDEPQKG
jgi:hypothetical protein